MDIKCTISGVRRAIDKTDKQVLFANRLTINRLMKEIKEALIKDMAKVFDRPTKWTLNSVRLLFAGMRYKNSTERRQEGIIYIEDEVKQSKKATAPGQYLIPQVEGGQRPLRPFELGAPYKGGFLVPARTAPIDRYGNIPLKTIRQIAKDLEQKQTDKADQVFIGPTLKNNRLMGVWLRNNKTQKLTPVLVWKAKLQPYKKRFNMADIGDNIVKAKYKQYFAESLEHAHRTAKP